MFYLKTCAMFPFEYFLAINIRFFLRNKGKDFRFYLSLLVFSKYTFMYKSYLKSSFS